MRPFHDNMESFIHYVGNMFDLPLNYGDIWYRPKHPESLGRYVGVRGSDTPSSYLPQNKIPELYPILVAGSIIKRGEGWRNFDGWWMANLPKHRRSPTSILDLDPSRFPYLLIYWDSEREEAWIVNFIHNTKNLETLSESHSIFFNHHSEIRDEVLNRWMESMTLYLPPNWRTFPTFINWNTNPLLEKG